MQMLRNILFKLKFILLSNSVFYISNSGALPPPLTKAEEEVIMDQIRNGDEKAREPLIVHNLRLVVYIAKKFENANVNIEDLISQYQARHLRLSVYRERDPDVPEKDRSEQV